MSDWGHEPDLRALHADLRPDPAELQRVRARLRHPHVPARARHWRPLLAVAVAAGLLLWFFPRNEGERALNSPERWAEEQISRDVDLHFQGQGVAGGTERAPVIRWEQGEISLSVPHGQGLALRVQTPEAEILDLGTRFTVSRDARGTFVSVDEGRVSVTCLDGTARFLVAEQRLACPRSAAAALALARDRQKERASPAEILEMLQRGLARTDADGAVRDELRYLEVETLDALGRAHEAREAAEAALAAGDSPRWRALAATAARVAVAEGDCAAALPLLRRLTATDPDPVGQVLLADCLAPEHPAEARAALQAAMKNELTAEQRAQVEARLAWLERR